MARKTRKKIDMPENGNTKQHKKYQVGIYARLSVVTEEKKAESIDNQIIICKEYIGNNSDMFFVNVYTDVGKSGMHFHRTGFERMIKDAKEGKINCIIAKDLSRIGRNHLETGFYMEKFFPEHKIRMIAVTDCFDSLEREEEELYPLKNLVNEMYVRDISTKVASSKRIRWENGEYMGGIPPYGYKIVKMETERHLEIEEETAKVVRRIYQWYLGEMQIGEIIEMLKKRGVQPPSEFHKTKIVCKKNDMNIKLWSFSAIKHILTNPIYMGCMIKIGKGEKTATHPPIISKKVYFEVQKRFAKHAEM